MKRRRPAPSPPADARRAVPACDWDATRSAYLDRFGPLFASHVSVWGGEPQFYVLCFWSSAHPGARVVYATFGAPEGEVFIETVAPALGLGALIEDAAHSFPHELPALVGARGLHTPFKGVIVLPEEDGGFRVPAGDGSRPVLRAIALTGREKYRAIHGSVAEVLAKVRAAGDVADLLRDCTVAPEQSDCFRELAGPAAVRSLRRALAQEQETLRERRAHGAPCEDTERTIAAYDAGLSYLVAALPPVGTDAELAADLAAADPAGRYAIVLGSSVQWGIDAVIAELYDVPAAVRGFQLILLAAVGTHPDACPLVEAAAALSDECPPPPSLSPADHRAILVKRLSQVAEALSETYPGPGFEALLRVALEAVDAPRDDQDPEHLTVLTARAGWPIGVLAMYKAVLPRATRADRALLAAYRMALEGGLDYGFGSAERTTPLERLAHGAQRFASYLLLGYVFGVGREVERTMS
jgi:hypothetical protein